MPRSSRIPTYGVKRVNEIAALAMSLLLALPGCSTRVVNTSDQLPPVQQSSAVLARPQQVFVADFTADSANLQLDQGVGLRLQRTLQGDNEAADRDKMLADVQNAIADTLVASIQKMGLPAQRAAGMPPPAGNVLVVGGQILQVNQGNRTRRLGIGFGAGKSDVSAKVQVSYERAGAPPQLVQTYDADSNSGRKPGLALGAASAAEGSVAPLVVTGVTGVASEKYKSEVAKEGEKLAKHVAYDLGAFFVQKGWIPASAAPARSLR
jgi:Domain of unknown function (DUF4410)